jgi:hypothetical protein
MISSSRRKSCSARPGLGKLSEPGMCLVRKVQPPTVMTSMMSWLASSLAFSSCLLIVSIGHFFRWDDLLQMIR